MEMTRLRREREGATASGARLNWKVGEGCAHSVGVKQEVRGAQVPVNRDHRVLDRCFQEFCRQI